MIRLFVETPPGADGQCRLSGAEARHLRTLRAAPGDRVWVFDPHGREHEVVLASISPREAVGRVVATRDGGRESALALVLAAALIKRDKMDWVIEKATELGVARIIPMTTRYTVAHGAPLERWRRIALAASKQCGRTRVPAIDAVRPIDQVLRDSWSGLKVVAWEDPAAPRWQTLPGQASEVIVVVGPEGGFHLDETATAQAAGFVLASLGRRILRAETAAVVAAALCQHRWGDG